MYESMAYSRDVRFLTSRPHLTQGSTHLTPCPQVVKCTGLKGGIFDRMDPFVTMELRKGREAKVG